MYFTDRGIEELERRRGDEEVTLAWLAEQLQAFVDAHPDFDLATAYEAQRLFVAAKLAAGERFVGWKRR